MASRRVEHIELGDRRTRVLIGGRETIVEESARDSSMSPPMTDALVKLVEVVLSGFGAVRLLEPWNKRRLAHATAEEMRVLARAEIDVAKIRLEGEMELRQLATRLLPAGGSDATSPVEAEAEPIPLLPTRVRERLEYQEAKRQLNVEQVALLASNELRGQEASTDPVDEDWVARFFGAVQDVSSEQMQMLWAKILAGEVMRPGSFSLRCLEAVKNLSKDEALPFESIDSYLVEEQFLLRSLGDFETKTGIGLARALRLSEAGLLNADTSLSFAPTFEAGTTLRIRISDVVVVATSQVAQREGFDTFVLTRVGVELSSLFRTPADRNYVRAFVEQLRRVGCTVETFELVPDASGLVTPSTVDLFPLPPVPPV
jgi:hypothetical protein